MWTMLLKSSLIAKCLIALLREPGQVISLRCLSVDGNPWIHVLYKVKNIEWGVTNAYILSLSSKLSNKTGCFNMSHFEFTNIGPQIYFKWMQWIFIFPYGSHFLQVHVYKTFAERMSSSNTASSITRMSSPGCLSRGDVRRTYSACTHDAIGYIIRIHCEDVVSIYL